MSSRDVNGPTCFKKPIKNGKLTKDEIKEIRKRKGDT